MKIRLEMDYRGWLTGEKFYKAGVYVVGDKMSQGHADALVDAGRAVIVEDVRAVDPPKKKGGRGGL